MCLAIPAKVKSIDNDTAIADFGGITKKVSLGILSGVKEGDHILVHAGFAIGKVRPQEAEDTRRALEELKDVSQTEITGKSVRHLRMKSV